MRFREIVTESQQIEEGPLDYLKGKLTGLGAALGSKQLAGLRTSQKMAKALYNDVLKWAGSAGLRQVTPRDLLTGAMFRGDTVMPKILDKMGIADDQALTKKQLLQATNAYAIEYNRTGGVADGAADQDLGVSGEQADGMHPDAIITGTKPLTVNFRGVSYMYNDTNAQWLQDTGKGQLAKPNAATTTFIDQQADIYFAAKGARMNRPHPEFEVEVPDENKPQVSWRKKSYYLGSTGSWAYKTAGGEKSAPEPVDAFLWQQFELWQNMQAKKNPTEPAAPEQPAADVPGTPDQTAGQTAPR